MQILIFVNFFVYARLLFDSAIFDDNISTVTATCLFFPIKCSKTVFCGSLAAGYAATEQIGTLSLPSLHLYFYL
jgi:hypothetical protein